MIKRWKEKKLSELFKENRAAIEKYNINFCPKLAMIGMIISVIALSGTILNPHLKMASFMYGTVGMVCTGIFLAIKIEKLKKYALAFIYLEFIALFMLVLYLSIVVAPDRAAASMLIVLTIFPITFIDKPQRLMAVNGLMFLVHTVCAYKVKGAALGNLDVVNCLVAVVVGCFCGFYVVETKLQNFNLARLLAYEKETDVLTTLGNRRKLVQRIHEMETKKFSDADGVMLFDIDFFKQFNDKYGHQAGDLCLRTFGRMLRETDWGCEVSFYRYGGEEFVALLWDVTEEKFKSVAEQIRKKTEEISLPQGKITTSIGYAYCKNNREISYEKWLGRADKAVYVAKKQGRNCVVEYLPEMEDN